MDSFGKYRWWEQGETPYYLFGGAVGNAAVVQGWSYGDCRGQDLKHPITITCASDLGHGDHFLIIPFSHFFGGDIGEASISGIRRIYRRFSRSYQFEYPPQAEPQSPSLILARRFATAQSWAGYVLPPELVGKWILWMLINLLPDPADPYTLAVSYTHLTLPTKA